MVCNRLSFVKLSVNGADICELAFVSEMDILALYLTFDLVDCSSCKRCYCDFLATTKSFA